MTYFHSQVWDLPAARARFGRYLEVELELEPGSAGAPAGSALTPLADVLKLWPTRYVELDEGELLIQGLAVRLRLHRPLAMAKVDLGDSARFWPCDEALGRWRSLARDGTATIVYD
jgi:DNA polymerase-3 subunit alpha